MLTKILALAVTAAALTVSPAAADHAEFDCGFDTVSQADVTGDDVFTGAAYGYIASPTPEEGVSVRCYITVDGVERASTNLAAGTNAAVTFGRVTYTASDVQTVALCTEWRAGQENGTTCFSPDPTQIPPHPPHDFLGSVFDLISGLFGPECLVLQALAPGVPGVVDIDSEGDVAIAGIPFWDCPPFES